jgi:hypothetical protein
MLYGTGRGVRKCRIANLARELSKEKICLRTYGLAVNELLDVRPTLRGKIFVIISDSNILHTCGFSLGSDVYMKFYFPLSTDLKNTAF